MYNAKIMIHFILLTEVLLIIARIL